MLAILTVLKNVDALLCRFGIAGDGRLNGFLLRACTSLAERPAH